MSNTPGSPRETALSGGNMFKIPVFPSKCSYSVLAVKAADLSKLKF